jgi:type VI secretion system protein ImpA
MDVDVGKLLDPISEESPCGDDLEDSQLLASFDAYRIFGQISSPGDEIDWREVRGKAEEALGRSKDFRLLAHLAVAQLRTAGFLKFCDILSVASAWLERYPDTVFPRVDEDAILRKNALNNFADRMAVVDAVRRAPFVAHSQIGAFSLRDYEIATGKLAVASGEAEAGEGGEAPTESLILAALAAASTEALAEVDGHVVSAASALRRIDELMRASGGIEAAPDFDQLLVALDRIHALLGDQLTQRSASVSSAADGGSDAQMGGVIGVGSIRSREDAMRALDAVASFFRRNEPSSPVPMFIERAKRLVDKDFLDVLADVVPEAVPQARLAGGIRDE